MEGIKETKEVIVGSMKLGVVLYKAFADGVQATDIATVVAKIQGDATLQAELIAAYNDANKVPAEIKDLTAAETVELVVETAKTALVVIAELKK